MSMRAGDGDTDGAARGRRRAKVLTAASGKFGLLLVALIALMAMTPIIIQGPIWDQALSLFTGAVLLAGLHAARPGEKPVVIGLGLAALDFAMGRCAAWTGVHWIIVLQILLWLITLLYVTVTILESIFEDNDVTIGTLQASLCVYLLIGLTGGFLFALVDVVQPRSFVSTHEPVVWTDESSRALQFMRLFVFSYATLSGSSYNEIAPTTGFAMNIVSLEALTGQIYLAVVIARLVGIHSSQPAR